MIKWVRNRVRRQARRIKRKAKKTATRARKGIITGVDRRMTRADARWEEFFETTLGPRLTSWMETGAPRPVLLAKCLARLAEKQEDLSALEAFVGRCLERFGEEPVLRAVSRAVRQLPPAPKRAQTRLVRAVLRHLSTEATEDFGEHNIDIVWRDLPARRVLARAEYRLGRLNRPLELLDRSDGDAETLRRELEAEQKVLREGIALSAPKAAVSGSGSRIMYVVAHCLPIQSIGYTIRTQSLVAPLRDLGWEVEVFARHGYPADRTDEPAAPADLDSTEVEGVPHHFHPDAGAGDLDLAHYVDAAAAALVSQAGSFRPSVIHAASNHRVGLAGIEAARRLGIPSIYEMRGVWHYSRAAREPRYQDSDQFQLAHKLELQAASSADRVLVNGPALGDLLVASGVPAERITLVPNGVDVDRFQPRPRATRLADTLGLNGRFVVGFIGTFFHFEGIDYLLHAARALRKRDMRFLVVGDGPEKDSLEQLARELGVADIVRFTGRVPHDTVLDYYSLLDVAVYPRRGLPVAELVPPLKPLEAMATGTPVIVSSATALARMVTPGTTGLVHTKDDVDSLCQSIEQLRRSPALRERLATAARAHVQTLRWSDSAAAIAAVYRSLGLRTDTAQPGHPASSARTHRA
jgi:glycosyltransferase involved in cell wall biosynthesis